MGQNYSSSLSQDPGDGGETQSLLSPAQPPGSGRWYAGGAEGGACPKPFKSVYTNIHRIRREIIQLIGKAAVWMYDMKLILIDDPYGLEQLRDPRMNIAVVRPLVDRLFDPEDVSIVYCLLVNKTQFLKERLSQAHQQSVCTTRATLCELVASRILRRFHEDSPGNEGLLLLAQILVGGFDPFQGAPDEVIPEHSNFSWAAEGHKKRLPALEIAIISESKLLLSSSACQRIVGAIYAGQIVYDPSTWVDLLPDHYKSRNISLYSPHKAPLLNHYRLRVPRTRNVLEIGQFLILLLLYFCVMVDRDVSRFGIVEFGFILYSAGWSLDLLASILEHGWQVYTQNMWSFLDVAYSIIFATYLVLRIHGWRIGQVEPAQQALDVLAMGAPVLVPRLAFNFLSENMLFVSLRAMMRDFTVLSGLAVWCFAGFLLSMFWLSDGDHAPITICKWMLWIWFGLDGTGIPQSVEFHWILGPILMITFTFLGNTLFLTILVSMLSTTFSTIVANATAEIQFRRAVLTLEGVKSDAIFAYQPPFNLLAILILLPAKFVLTPRWFHKINVTAVRTLNAPLLLLIGMLERRTLWAGEDRKLELEQLPKPKPKPPSRAGLWDFSRGFSVHRDIHTVFNQEPPQSVEDEISTEESLHQSGTEESHVHDIPTPTTPGLQKLRTGTGRKSRRDSMAPFAGLSEHVKDIFTEEAGRLDEHTKIRLDSMESSILRMETMLQRLVGDADTGWRGQDRNNTGRMEDLDTSGDADLPT